MPKLLGRTGIVGEWSPLSIDGCQLWLRSDLGVTNGAGVSVWEDQSGNGHDATQGTATYRPTLQTNQINGYPSIRFDGSDDYLQASGVADFWNGEDLPRSFFIVKKFLTTDQPRCFMSWCNSGNQYMRVQETISGTIYFHGKSTTMFDAKSVSFGSILTVWQIIDLVDTGTLGYTYLNGSVVTNGGNTNVGAFSNNQFGIGCYIYNLTNHCNIDFAEIIMYDSALSTEDRQDVENYLNDRYAIY